MPKKDKPEEEKSNQEENSSVDEIAETPTNPQPIPADLTEDQANQRILDLRHSLNITTTATIFSTTRK